MLTSEDFAFMLQLLESVQPTAEVSALKQKIVQQLSINVSYDLECE